MMQVLPTKLPEVKIIEPRVFGDDRGFFVEGWNERSFETLGLTAHFVQDNHSRSRAGVVRGLHYQLSCPQGKLVRVTCGRVFDVAVDIRRSSQNFGQWVGTELSGDNHRMMWIPPGFAHGFLSMQDDTDLLYKCTEFYSPEDERTIAWDDPDLDISWPVFHLDTLVSEKDRRAPSFKNAELYE